MTPTEMIHYGTTKTAQLAVSRGIAELTAGTGVTSNAILAGPTRSECVEKFVDDLAHAKQVSPKDVESEFLKNIRPTSLLKRFATAEEVAAMVSVLRHQRRRAACRRRSHPPCRMNRSQI